MGTFQIPVDSCDEISGGGMGMIAMKEESSPPIRGQTMKFMRRPDLEPQTGLEHIVGHLSICAVAGEARAAERQRPLSPPTWSAVPDQTIAWRLSFRQDASRSRGEAWAGRPADGADPALAAGAGAAPETRCALPQWPSSAGKPQRALWPGGGGASGPRDAIDSRPPRRAQGRAGPWTLRGRLARGAPLSL